MAEITTVETDGRSTITFTGDVFCGFISPCIYFWMRGSKYLYIGSSMNGFSRVFDKSHHIFDPRRIISTDRIEIKFFASSEEWRLRLLEQAYIEKYKPKFNGRKNKRLLKSEEEKAICKMVRDVRGSKVKKVKDDVKPKGKNTRIKIDYSKFD